MAKWYGPIGFAETVETVPGVWVEQITERKYFGEMNPITRRLQSTDQVNGDIVVSNKLSIVADPYASAHFHSMRYVEFQGVRWTISNVEVAFPRLILSLGVLWNGEQA